MALRRFIQAFPKSRTRCVIIILFDDSIISALIIVRFIVAPLIMRVVLQTIIKGTLGIINTFGFLIYYETYISLRI